MKTIGFEDTSGYEDTSGFEDTSGYEDTIGFEDTSGYEDTSRQPEGCSPNTTQLNGLYSQRNLLAINLEVTQV